MLLMLNLFIVVISVQETKPLFSSPPLVPLQQLETYLLNGDFLEMEQQF